MAHEDDGVVRDGDQRHGDTGQRDARAAEPPRPEPPHQRPRGDAHRHRPGALHHGQHARVRRRVPEPLDDRVDRRPADPRRQHRQTAAEHQGPQPLVPPQVPRAFDGLLPQGRPLPLGPALAHPQQPVHPRGEHERHGVQERHPGTAVRGEQARARERRHQFHALVRRHPQAVEVAEQLLVDGRRDQGGLRRVRDDAARPVHHEHREEDPQPARAVDGEEREDQHTGREVGGHEQRPAARAVGERAEQRADEGGRPQRELTERGESVGPGQLLHPDSGDQPQRGAPEAGDHHRTQIQPRVAVPQDAPDRRCHAW